MTPEQTKAVEELRHKTNDYPDCWSVVEVVAILWNETQSALEAAQRRASQVTDAERAEQARLINERDDLRAKLLVEQAGGAEMRAANQEALECITEWREADLIVMDDDDPVLTKLHRALSTSCGQSFLAERERQQELLAYVRENVTVEIAAHGDCSCDVPAGDTPCVYCASIHFNERTDAQSTALQPK